jgi:hypothetical protein
MKVIPALVATFAILTAPVFAKAPKPLTDLNKTLSTAAKDHKMTFVLLGRAECGNCQETKEMVRDAKIPVTEADYVMANLDADNQKVQDEFLGKYGETAFGTTLPFVVVTDEHGTILARSGGLKTAAEWTSILKKAKAKATAKTGAKPAAATSGKVGKKST